MGQIKNNKSLRGPNAPLFSLSTFFCLLFFACVCFLRLSKNSNAQLRVRVPALRSPISLGRLWNGNDHKVSAALAICMATLMISFICKYKEATRRWGLILVFVLFLSSLHFLFTGLQGAAKLIIFGEIRSFYHYYCFSASFLPLKIFLYFAAYGVLAGFIIRCTFCRSLCSGGLAELL